jgi:hypothetical protein
MQSQPLVCSIARPCTVLLLYRAVLHLRQRTYPAKCGKCDQRRRIGLNKGQVCGVLAQMILEHKQGRTPDLASENQSGRSILSRWMRAKWPYSYLRIHFFRDSDTPGIRSSIRLTRTNRGWKMLMSVRATRDLNGPLAGKDISQ